MNTSQQQLEQINPESDTLLKRRDDGDMSRLTVECNDVDMVELSPTLLLFFFAPSLAQNFPRKTFRKKTKKDAFEDANEFLVECVFAFWSIVK